MKLKFLLAVLCFYIGMLGGAVVIWLGIYTLPDPIGLLIIAGGAALFLLAAVMVYFMWIMERSQEVHAA